MAEEERLLEGGAKRGAARLARSPEAPEGVDPTLPGALRQSGHAAGQALGGASSAAGSTVSGAGQAVGGAIDRLSPPH